MGEGTAVTLPVAIAGLLLALAVLLGVVIATLIDEFDPFEERGWGPPEDNEPPQAA